MEPRTLQFIASACGGELRAGAPGRRVTGLTTDSRKVGAGELFFALPGDRFDGHDFVPTVAAAGAGAVVVARSWTGSVGDHDCGVVVVDDTRRALGRLAAAYRAQFAARRIAVGGSNGKTTTKELLAAVLAERLATLASEASFNNDIGVPLTLLRLTANHAVAVLEAGTNHPGELALLVALIAPEFGVITSIGREHLEHFGDVAGVAEEEGALAAGLPAEGRLFLNGDDPWSAALAARSAAPVIRVGCGPANDWRAEQIRLDEQGAEFSVRGPRAELAGQYRVNLLGRHQVGNALLALAVAAELGLTAAEIRRGLAACRPARMRLQTWDWNGVRVLDDAYNANADSMLAALATLRDLPCAGRRVAVLGDMAELGGQAPAAHAEVGRGAVAAGVDRLFAVGRMAGVLGSAARAEGLAAVSEYATPAAAAAELRSYLRPGDVLLLKASRSTRLERLGEALRAPAEGESAHVLLS